MKYLSAYMLCLKAKNAEPNDSAIKSVLDAAGCDYEEERIQKVLESLNGKKIDDLIQEGSQMFAKVPSGGMGSGSASAPSGGNAANAQEEAPEEKEESAESESEMGFDLFG